jgi:LysM repeat protein
MRKVLILVLLGVMALAFSVPVKPVAACGSGVHIVRYGETLFSIGRWYGVNPWTIASTNGLVNPNYIYAGQRLVIPGSCYGWYPPCYGCRHGYVVRYGDTLSSIAWRHGVNMYALAQVNGIYNLNRIYAGQYLVIP